MSSEGGVEVRLDERAAGAVAFVVIDRPAKLNALNSHVMAAFVAAVEAVSARADLRAIVVTGAGARAFVGGADIAEMGAIDGPEAAQAFIRKVHACCDAVRRAPAPVIARIQGYCFGAGLELAAACDLRVASQSAVFGMPEVKLGIPSVVEAALLPALVGWGRTREMLLLGENFTAAEALEWRFVEKVAADLDGAVEDWIAKLMTSKPEAVRLQKTLIRQWEDLPLSHAVAAGVVAFGKAFEGPEPSEAMAEFLAAQAARRR